MSGPLRTVFDPQAVVSDISQLQQVVGVTSDSGLQQMISDVSGRIQSNEQAIDVIDASLGIHYGLVTTNISAISDVSGRVQANEQDIEVIDASLSEHYQLVTTNISDISDAIILISDQLVATNGTLKELSDNVSGITTKLEDDPIERSWDPIIPNNFQISPNTDPKISLFNDDFKEVSMFTAMFSDGGVPRNDWSYYYPITTTPVSLTSPSNLMSIDKFVNYRMHCKLIVNHTTSPVACLTLGIDIEKGSLRLLYLDFDDSGRPVIKSQNDPINQTHGLVAGVYDIVLNVYHRQVEVILNGVSHILKTDINTLGYVGLLCNNNVKYENVRLNDSVRSVIEGMILKGNRLEGVYEKVTEFNKTLNMDLSRVQMLFFPIPIGDGFMFEAYNYPTMIQYHDSVKLGIPLKYSYSLYFGSTIGKSMGTGIVNQWSLADDGFAPWDEQMNTWVNTKFLDWRPPTNESSKGIILYTNDESQIPEAIKDKAISDNLVTIDDFDGTTEQHYFTIIRQQQITGFAWQANFVNLETNDVISYTFESNASDYSDVPTDITNVTNVSTQIPIFKMESKESFDSLFFAITGFTTQIPVLPGMVRGKFNTALMRNKVRVTNGVNGDGPTEYTGIKLNRFGGYPSSLSKQFNTFSVIGLAPFEILTIVLNVTAAQAVSKNAELYERGVRIDYWSSDNILVFTSSNPNYDPEDQNTWSLLYKTAVQLNTNAQNEFGDYLDNSANQCSMAWYGGKNPALPDDDPNKNDISLLHQLAIDEKIAKFGTDTVLETQYKAVADNVILLAPGIAENPGRTHQAWGRNNPGIGQWRSYYFTDQNGNHSTPTEFGDLNDPSSNKFLGMVLLRTSSMSDANVEFISDAVTTNTLEISVVEVVNNKIVEASSPDVLTYSAGFLSFLGF